MIAENALIFMTENAVNQIVENKGFNNFDVGNMCMDAAIGGISGALGGVGDGTKHMTNLGKRTVTRTFKVTQNKGIKAGMKEAKKAFTYYIKNTSKFYNKMFSRREVKKSILSAIGTVIASLDYTKRTFWRMIGA